MSEDDSRTLAPPKSVAVERVDSIAITIAYHPDVSRIGERCVLDGSSIEISRAVPLFAQPGATPRPLADRYLSRSPIARLERVDNGVSIQAAATAPVVVDGRVVGASKGWQTFGDDALAAGLTVEIADRIVLVVHAHDTRPPAPVYGLVGESAGIARVREDIRRVADLDVPVLLRGETGTGKELVAQAIHAAGKQGRPLVAINVAAIPPTTAASELFGHVRGAFTGASGDRDGVFVRADGGTLFLDEVGETPFDVQPMLLRALETGEITPVGGSSTKRVTVRVIAATDADLETQVAESGFRSALFHRLAGYQILIPALRERRDDIGRLVIHFLRSELAATGDLARLERQRDAEQLWLPVSLVARFVRHAWLGNVRQLRNAIRQLAISNRGAERVKLDPALERTLGTPAPAPAAPVEVTKPRRDVAGITDDELLDALRANKWRAVGAAAQLGVSRSTLYNLIERSKRIRKPKSIPEAELRRAHDDHAGDVDAMAAALEVSRRALQTRLSELDLE